MRSFAGSLKLILQAIQRDQGSAVVCLYEQVDPGILVLRETAGAALDRLETGRLQLSYHASEWLRNLDHIEEIRNAQSDARVSDFPEVLLHQFKAIAVAPVRQDEVLRGVITLGWNEALSGVRASSDRLQALVDCATWLLIREGQTSATLQLIAEIERLETDLAEAKIAERAVGFLSSPSWTQRTPFTIQEHVSRVLDGSDINRNLREHLGILQSRLQDRRLLATAKAHVQSALGVTEESAYLFLRNTSRRTRRPLREIAEEVLSGDALPRQFS